MNLTINSQTYKLPDQLAAAVESSLADWQSSGKVKRLWTRDAELWTDNDENDWLGWLGIVDEEIVQVQRFSDLAEEIRSAEFTHALVLGMGGSSLCPEVMAMTFGKQDGYPEMHVLDSTDPAQIKSFEKKIDLAKTVFVVSSKSGTTLEPNIFKDYFFDCAQQAIGGKAGQRFIAITDPGSKLQDAAERDGFRHIFFGRPSIGGRYSALSDFGLMPSAIMGVDVNDFLSRTQEMVKACAADVPAQQNPGVVLGNILGVLEKDKRNKVTIVTSPGISDLGAWLEQLLAESTGKESHGLIPVDRETLGPPEVYDYDRVFVYLRLDSDDDEKQELAINALESAGQPAVRISIADKRNLGQEFFRWEIATAVAGSIIGINAFNQPDVEASKIATRQLTDEYEKSGSLPPETSILDDAGIKLFANEANAPTLAEAAGDDKSLVGYLRAHLNRLSAGDYFTVLAYVEMNRPHEVQLQKLRHAVRDAKRVATCLGFGPRFLHSTGQAYKGGPNTGVFLQVTCDDAADLTVPGRKYTFGVVKAAQARGDFAVLAKGGRRALRVHLGSDVDAGLAKLSEAVSQALS